MAEIFQYIECLAITLALTHAAAALMFARAPQLARAWSGWAATLSLGLMASAELLVGVGT